MVFAVIEDLRGIFEGLASTEARLVATIGVVAIAGAAAVLAAPVAVRWLHGFVTTRVLEHERVPEAVSSFNWRVPTTLIVRVLQVSVFVGAMLALLVTWGFVNAALTAAALIGIAVPQLVKLLLTVGVVAGALIGIDLLETRLDEYAAESDALNQHQQGIVFRVLQLSVLAAAGIAGLSLWGIGIGGLFVGAGFLGIVIGTAARTTIGSLIAGFVLMFSRPFELGDWVEVDGDEGIVSDITVINTRIRNQHGEEIVIPNDRVANATITNRTRRGQLRLSVDVGVDYDADVQRAESIVADALADTGPILDNPTPQVVPKSLADSAVVLECRYWIDHPSAARRTMANAAVVRNVKAALDDAGVKIPYPQRELAGREETDGFRVNAAAQHVTDDTTTDPPSAEDD